MVQSICLRALIEENKGNLQAAYENYSGVWDKLITPVLHSLSMASSSDALPEILMADSHRIREISNGIQQLLAI